MGSCGSVVYPGVDLALQLPLCFFLMFVHLLFIPPWIPPYSLSLYMSQEILVCAAGFPLLSPGGFCLVSLLCSVLFPILSYVMFYPTKLYLMFPSVLLF